MAPTRQISVYLPSTLVAKLKEVAKREQRTLAGQIRWIIDRELEARRLEKAHELADKD